MLNFQEYSASQPLIAFAGGGSGGHLYPALAVVEAIRQRVPGARIVFFGTSRSIDEKILAGRDCELVRQPLEPLSMLPWRWPAVVAGLHRATSLSRARLENDPPDVLIGTGGLASVPAMREAHCAGIPTVLLNPDAVPGRANRNLAAMVETVFVQWDDTLEHLPSGTNGIVSGCPVRSDFNHCDRAAGLAHFSLETGLRTLLVTGASQGARTINETVIAILDFLETIDGWQILHLTGEQDYETVQAAYVGKHVRATVLAYTEQMPEALAAADLVIGRAGASTLAEITAVGRASVLMPYPFHKDQHQLLNARCLARVSAARILQDGVDSAVNGPRLREVLAPLLAQHEMREAMAAAARRIGRGNAAARIAEHVLQLAEKRAAVAAVESVQAFC